MRVLVTGARGQLGKAMLRWLIPHDVVPLGRDELDIADGTAVTAVVRRERPDCVINCAAYTDVDGAEKQGARAMQVNGEGVRNLALACKGIDAELVQFSTDYIFDGRKRHAYTIHDRPAPLNVYGESKLRGEQYALALLQQVYVVRTSWLYGVEGHNFVEVMLRLGEERKRVSVVTDQRGSPTFADDVARVTVDLITAGRCGVYHVTNQGETTWYEFARSIFRALGMAVEVQPTTSDLLGRPARRPHNSVLDASPLMETIGYLLPPWEDALKRYLTQRKVAIL